MAIIVRRKLSNIAEEQRAERRRALMEADSMDEGDTEQLEPG